jgi:hypothetical protein
MVATSDSHYSYFSYNSQETLGDRMDRGFLRVLRGGVADLHRRAEISERAAERYLDALAGVDEQTTLQELLDRLGQPKQWKGRHVRALHPLGRRSCAVGDHLPRGIHAQRFS